MDRSLCIIGYGWSDDKPQDGTGKLWIAYEAGGDINVVWSISDDHLSWNTSGAVIGTGVTADDLSSCVAFENKIGVFWSDQDADAYFFRFHLDGTIETEWSPRETVALGSDIADDHQPDQSAQANLHLRLEPDIRRLSATGPSVALSSLSTRRTARFVSRS